jgi:hypothetical protein
MARPPRQGDDAGKRPAGWIQLVGFTEQDERPKIAVWALAQDGKVIERSDVDDQGNFTLSPKALEAAHRVLVGPPAEDPAELARERLSLFRADKVSGLIERNEPLEIARSDWLVWILGRRCVNGSVRRCYLTPWLTWQLMARIQPKIASTLAMAIARPLQERIGFSVLRSGQERAQSRNIKVRELAIADEFLAYPIEPVLRWRCEPICDGLVEVYRRICCCHPFVIYDPRIPELVAGLESLIPHIPEEIEPPRRWPPRPQPDPSPDPAPLDLLAAFGMVQGGALSERTANAGRDLEATRSLPADEIVSYINAREYLWCWPSCGTPEKVAQGTINPDAKFNICWFEPRRLLLVNCHEEYAYVVRQNVDGSTITIYDGLAAGQWFRGDDEPTLTSYHPQAQGCRHNDFPGVGAFALLQDIGLTGSYELNTPPADSWDSVAAPLAFNHGLAFPENNPFAALGKYRNRNWGGLLRLRYHFSEPMRALGARYYRVSVVAADANGNPTGPRSNIAPDQWRYYEVSGTDILVKKVALGPHSAGGHDDLYEIPYDADRDWQSGQYHALLDTTVFANGRHLLRLEIFNAAGQLLRPTGTADPGGSVQAAFTYRRWQTEVGPTLEVHFAALTHLFWWDNRKAVAHIVDLRKDGNPSSEECQFIVGENSSLFSIGYRAYHSEPLFMLDHRIWWRRGLGGPTGILTAPHPNPYNVGVPPSPPHQSGQDNFGPLLGPPPDPGMLDGHAKCSFSVNLHVNVKTFNGIGTLDGLDAWDQAAFALEIES